METGLLISSIALIVVLSVFVVLLAISIFKTRSAKLELASAICCTALFLISSLRSFFAIKTEQPRITLFLIVAGIWLINAVIHWCNYNDYHKIKKINTNII